MTLAEFILDRVAEDEAAARGAMGGRWSWASVDFNSEAAQHHGDRQNPARVVRECEAIRGIVERLPDLERLYELHGDDSAAAAILSEHVNITLPALASIWADHPDYQA